MRAHRNDQAAKRHLPRGSGHYSNHPWSFIHVRFLLKEQCGVPEVVMRESEGKRMGQQPFPLLAVQGKLSVQAFKNSFLLCSTERPDKLTVI